MAAPQGLLCLTMTQHFSHEDYSGAQELLSNSNWHTGGSPPPYNKFVSQTSGEVNGEAFAQEDLCPSSPLIGNSFVDFLPFET